MKRRLIYVELKSGQSDRGDAWIGYGEFSKSGRTIYFNDQAFRSCKGRGIGANYFDIESNDEYWISGLKREGGDRHWAGGGKIFVHDDAVEEYLQLRGHDELDPQDYEVCAPRTGDIRERINALENQSA